MLSRSLIVFTALLFLCARANARPNIVFILIDDMGYGDLGCYGNTRVKTPNIDRLAAEGIRFTQFYASAPICSPSRVAFTTGQYPVRYGITSFIASRRENEERGMAQWLPTTAPSLARVLQTAGYRTAHFGKWHMGGGRDIGEAPLISEYGFDESLTQFEGLGDRVLPTFDTLFEDQEHHAHPLANASAKLGRGKVEFVKRSEITKRFVDHAMKFIKTAGDDGKPFYINLWPDDVHTPCEPSLQFRGDGSPAAMYRGVIEELDQQLAPLFDFIRNDAKLRESTLIILASDNGHDPVVPGSANLRGHKGNLYEAGIREPFIVHWPGGRAGGAGTVNERTVMTGIDLMPSLLHLAGIDKADDIACDGEDVAPAFTGEQPVRRSTIFWSRPPDRPGSDNAFPDYAVREGKWKLLVESNGDRPELFDISADPRETTNVADQHPEIVSQLKNKLTLWRERCESKQKQSRSR